MINCIILNNILYTSDKILVNIYFNIKCDYNVLKLSFILK